MNGEWPLSGNQSDEQLDKDVYLDRQSKKMPWHAMKQTPWGRKSREKKIAHTENSRKLTQKNGENKLACPEFVAHSKNRLHKKE